MIQDAETIEIKRSLVRELDVLRDKLLLMGGEVETAVRRSVQSLLRRNSETALSIIENDFVIDSLESEIDRSSIEILTYCKPIEAELRMVVSIAKITPILERIGDHAVSISCVALKLNDEPELDSFGELHEMAENTLNSLQESLDTFTTGNAEYAKRLIAKDDLIDEIYEHLMEKWLYVMSRDASVSARLTRLLFVAKHLERIGDYVKDICELTIYMREAIFIKDGGQMLK